MRRRYVVAWVEVAPETHSIEAAGDQPTITVHELERVPRNTGLLDARGEPILIVEEPEQIGFVRF